MQARQEADSKQSLVSLAAGQAAAAWAQVEVMENKGDAAGAASTAAEAVALQQLTQQHQAAAEAAAALAQQQVLQISLYLRCRPSSSTSSWSLLGCMLPENVFVVDDHYSAGNSWLERLLMIGE